jgi:hypothetical protein
VSTGFAVEFYPHEVTSSASDGKRRGLTSLGGALHQVQGAVVFQSPEAWVVDFGVPAYREEAVGAPVSAVTEVVRLVLRTVPGTVLDNALLADVPAGFRQYFRCRPQERRPRAQFIDTVGRPVAYLLES